MHSSMQLALDAYSHLLPDMGLKERPASRLNALLTAKPKSEDNWGQKKSRSGEPGRNRTFNPQIKSLLLCQLSYWPTDRHDKPQL